MKKKIATIILCVFSFSSCANHNIIMTSEDIDYSSSTVIDGFESAVTVHTNLSNTTTITEVTDATSIASFYEISSLDVDMSFADSFDGIQCVLGIDIASNIPDDYDWSFSFDQLGHHIVYVDDYQEFINWSEETDPATGYQNYYPLEEEYHQISRLMIDNFAIEKFDSDYWAERAYRSNVDYVNSQGIETPDSSRSDGYCFTMIQSGQYSRIFYAHYLVGNYTISYFYVFDRSDTNEYLNYVDYCENIGLPTSSQMTESILR